MKVSIIVPLYNKAPYIRRALQSISAQTFADYEAIVVDDGSTDESAELAAAHPDPRVRVISQSNGGPGSARNLGIRAARGEYLTFLDADDEWLPEFLSESVRLLDGYGPQVASVTSGYFEYPAGRSTEEMWRKRGIREGVHWLEPTTPPALVVSRLAYMCPWSTMIRADVVRRLGGFFDRHRCLYGEDAFLWLKVLFGERVAFNLSPLVRFHTEASGLSMNLRGARPVEPFLTHPEEIEAVCPPELRDLLRRVLATRAFKTACVLGYWGRWREAAAMLRRFHGRDAWTLPYFVPALVCSTPVGSLLGSAWRKASALRSAARPTATT